MSTTNLKTSQNARPNALMGFQNPKIKFFQNNYNPKKTKNSKKNLKKQSIFLQVP